MLSHSENDFFTILGALIVFAFFVACVRAALPFGQGFEQGFGVRQNSDLRSIFSEDE